MERESGSGPFICRDRDPPPLLRAVAALGNFDGVHLGHRRLLEVAREVSEGSRPIAVLTFEPHPRDVFRPDEPAFRLTSERVKLKILGALGVDIVFVRRFDATLAATSAADFVGRIVARELAISAVVVGENFHFGRGREGTPEMLRSLALASGIGARTEAAVERDGGPVSSSRVRSALATGDVAAANGLLGHRWLVEGEVVHGAKRGRTLGFPTANIGLSPGCRLAHGIYAVRVSIAPGVVHAGVASYGRRPTFDDGEPLLETFIFDFEGDLYGRRIEVEFLDWIRGEERFASTDDLVRRMGQDRDEARVLAARPRPLRSYLG